MGSGKGQWSETKAMLPMNIPCNKEAERAAISLLYQNPNTIGLLPWQSDLFFDPPCQILFDDLQAALLEGDAPLDLISVTIRLSRNGKLEKIGGGGRCQRYSKQLARYSVHCRTTSTVSSTLELIGAFCASSIKPSQIWRRWLFLSMNSSRAFSKRLIVRFGRKSKRLRIKSTNSWPNSRTRKRKNTFRLDCPNWTRVAERRHSPRRAGSDCRRYKCGQIYHYGNGGARNCQSKQIGCNLSPGDAVQRCAPANREQHCRYAAQKLSGSTRARSKRTA